MNAEQKRAWLAVVSGIICLIGYLISIPFVGPQVAVAIFGLYGINGISGLIGRKERPDERDKIIARQATLGGFAASYGALWVGCMGGWLGAFAWKGQEQISVHVLGAIASLGFMVMWFVRGAAILVLYRRRLEAGHV